MREREYIILEATLAATLAAKVNDKFDQGYKLAGGLVCNGGTYAQAMWK